MSGNSNQKKADQLGMPIGTATHQLRKIIMFNMMGKLNLNMCFQCGKKIESVDQLSIEHKTPWLDSSNPLDLFFDLDNIAFSHLSCNISSSRQTKIGNHGTRQGYKRGCRCDKCREAHNLYHKKYHRDRQINK